MSLARYSKKRDFARTPEPRGAPAKARHGGGRFVVHEHHARRLHYDLRLEIGGVLKSWAVPKGPSLNPRDRRLAVHVEDHPLEYGDFEGIIPEGEYGGGTSVLWDRGRFAPRGDPEADYARGSLHFELAGDKLRGGFVLRRMKTRDDRGDDWLLMKEDDAAADPDGEKLIRERPESVLSGKTAAQLAAAPARVWPAKPEDMTEKPSAKKAAKTTAAKKTAKKTAKKAAAKTTAERRLPAADAAPPAAFTVPAPELATLVEAVPAGDEWLHEVKFDGYRLLAEVTGKTVHLWTRRGEDWSARLPWLAAALRERLGAAARRPRARGVAGPAALLDGELVHVDPDGVTRFQPLQRALADGVDAGLVYFAFDLLFLRGQDLRDMPLESRKRALAGLVPPEPEPGRVRLSEHVVGRGEPLFARACALGVEGVVSKRRDAPYRSGRLRDWLKVKCGRRQEVVVGGFTAARGGPREIGALLVGVYDDGGALRYVGKVGTGFDHDEATRLRERLGALKTARSPFAARPPNAARATFVRPETIVEVRFAEWTRDGRLRQPVYEGVREDRDPREVRRETAQNGAPLQRVRERPAPLPRPTRAPRAATAEVLGVPLTHPDRVLFPEDGITKRQLAEFYARIAEWTVPWIAGRPLSLVRCPDDVAGACFFQKHPRHGLPPGLLAADLDGDGGEDAYVYLQGAPGLAALVQIGAIELHTWGSTVARPDDPDRIVFDLDPDPGVPWARVKETALAVKARLEDLDLASFVKTTGGKGLHVVVPLTRGRQDWDTVKEFSRAIAREFVRAAPTLFTDQAAKARRKGRIFLDYLRNDRGATSVAPYTVRARARAPVSTPLRWDELDALASSQVYTLANLEQRLAGLRRDPWAALPTTKQFLRAAALRAVATPRRAA